MSNEDVDVDVEEDSSDSLSVHSSDCEVDVEANDSSDLDSIGACGSGEGMHVRKDHHNQLEKVRRKELGACYGSMKRFVKRLTGGRSGGRDSVLAVAHVLLRRELESFKIQKQKYKMNAEVLREMLPSIDSKHRAQVTEVMNNYLKMSEEPFETEQGLADTKSDDGWEDQEEEEESDEDNEDEEVDVDAIADLVPHIDDEDEDEDEDDGYIGDEDCDKDLSSEALLEELQE